MAGLPYTAIGLCVHIPVGLGRGGTAIASHSGKGDLLALDSKGCESTGGSTVTTVCHPAHGVPPLLPQQSFHTLLSTDFNVVAFWRWGCFFSFCARLDSVPLREWAL